MKKIISILLIVTSFLLIFSGCSSEPTNALELIESGYYNGTATLHFQNNSGETITNIKGNIILWTSDNVKVGSSNFYWNSSCSAGETLEIELEMNATGNVDRVGYFIESINNGEIDEYL